LLFYVVSRPAAIYTLSLHDALPISGGIGLFEVASHDLVDLGEVVQVGEEDVQLDDVLQLATSGFGHQGQIVEHAAYLGFKALDHFHGLGIQRDLAGQVHSVTHLDGLRVGTDRGRGVFTGDDLLVHEGLHWVQFFKRVIRTTPCRARIRLISCERCSRPRTRSASCTTLILPSRSSTLILSMLASATVILVASWAM